VVVSADEQRWLNFAPRERQAGADEQSENLRRVTGRLRGAIVQFCRLRLASVPRFRADELRLYVGTFVGEVAPDSPGRVLRQLRQAGVVDCVLLDRAGSFYEVRAVRDDKPKEEDES
jgi:hypothetical protein